MDARTREIVRIDKIATGGTEDGLENGTNTPNILDHCQAAEYVPELLPQGIRKDLKSLHVLQPDGASFKVTDESLVEWQKWRFRVGFNHREGATIHDVRYDGRSVMYRLSVSEMVSSKPPRITDFTDLIADCTVRGCSCTHATQAGFRFW
jgi:primary-amine oxidase